MNDFIIGGANTLLIGIPTRPLTSLRSVRGLVLLPLAHCVRSRESRRVHPSLFNMLLLFVGRPLSQKFNREIDILSDVTESRLLSVRIQRGVQETAVR